MNKRIMSTTSALQGPDDVSVILQNIYAVEQYLIQTFAFRVFHKFGLDCRIFSFKVHFSSDSHKLFLQSLFNIFLPSAQFSNWLLSRKLTQRNILFFACVSSIVP
jgi:hypothetical protein